MRKPNKRDNVYPCLVYPKAAIEAYSHIEPHDDLFISKYSLVHMCPTCIMHRSRCRIATIETEYKHDPLSPMNPSDANFPTRNPMNILWSRKACHSFAHFVNSHIRSTLPYIISQL